MKRMKIMAAVFLVFMLVVQIGAVQATDTVEMERFEERFTILSSLGIMEQDVVNPNESISRGDFASIAARLSGFNYGGTDVLNQFTDVDKNDEKAEDIATVLALNLMTGVTQQYFEPDRNVNFRDVVTALVKLTGHDKGKPDETVEYLKNAALLGITDGIFKRENDSVNLQELCDMVYETCHVKILVPTGVSQAVEYAQSKTQTILTQNLGIFEGKGIVDKNDVCSLEGGKGVGVGKISVDSEIYSSSVPGIQELLGECIEYYYQETEEENVILYAAEAKSQESLTVMSDEILEYEDGVLSYADGERTRTVRVPRGVYLIYNGRVQNTYDNSVYTPENGRLKLIDNNGDGKYDVINVKNYTACVVSKVDEENRRIYGEYGISLVLDDDSRLFLPDGGRAELSQVKEKMVVSALVDYQGIVTTANLSTSIVTGEIQERDDENHITISGVRYDMDPSAAQTGLELSPGFYGTFYLDDNGRICYVQSANKNEYAYLIRIKAQPALSDTVDMKLLRIDGNLYVYQNIGHLIVNGESYRGKDAIIEAMGGEDNSQLVVCEYDENGLPYKIETAYNYPLTPDYLNADLESRQPADRLRVMYSCYLDRNNPTTVTYKSTVASFNGRVSISEETLWFKIPKDIDAADDNDFEVLKNPTSRFYGDRSYSIEAYCKNKTSMSADIVITYESQKDLAYDEASPVNVVRSVTKGLDSEGNTVDKVTVLSWGKESSYALAQGLDAEKITTETGETVALRRGDVIRYLLNNKNEIIKISVLCRADGEGGPQITAPVSTTFGAAFRVTTGQVYTEDGDYMAFVPGEILEEPLSRDKYEVHRMERCEFYRYDFQKDRLIYADAGDVITYLESPENCSETFLYTYYGIPMLMVLYE